MWVTYTIVVSSQEGFRYNTVLLAIATILYLLLSSIYVRKAVKARKKEKESC